MPISPVRCWEGKELNPAGDGCVECPLGEYKDVKGNSACLTCSPGRTTDGTGQTACTECELFS